MLEQEQQKCTFKTQNKTLLIIHRCVSVSLWSYPGQTLRAVQDFPYCIYSVTPTGVHSLCFYEGETTQLSCLYFPSLLQCVCVFVFLTWRQYRQNNAFLSVFSITAIVCLRLCVLNMETVQAEQCFPVCIFNYCYRLQLLQCTIMESAWAV